MVDLTDNIRDRDLVARNLASLTRCLELARGKTDPFEARVVLATTALTAFAQTACPAKDFPELLRTQLAIVQMIREWFAVGPRGRHVAFLELMIEGFEDNLREATGPRPQASGTEAS